MCRHPGVLIRPGVHNPDDRSFGLAGGAPGMAGAGPPAISMGKVPTELVMVRVSFAAHADTTRGVQPGAVPRVRRSLQAARMPRTTANPSSAAASGSTPTIPVWS